MPALRQAVADFYERRFGVSLDPDTEVLPLIGSKEGLAHIALAFVDPGDARWCPTPAIPSTTSARAWPAASPFRFRSRRRTGSCRTSTRSRCRRTRRSCGSTTRPTRRPPSPTRTARARVAFAPANDLLLCHDAAYSEITFDGYVAPTILQAPGAKDVAVEFGSLSKTYNMTGWRIGYAVGNAAAIRARHREDEPRLRDLQRGPGRGDRRAHRPAGPRRTDARGLPRSAATWW